MNNAQKYYLFFPFFIKVVVNKSKAYCFLIIGIIFLYKKILLSVIMPRFHFLTAKQGTWVHKDDRGPFSADLSHQKRQPGQNKYWCHHQHLPNRARVIAVTSGLYTILKEYFYIDARHRCPVASNFANDKTCTKACTRQRKQYLILVVLEIFFYGPLQTGIQYRGLDNTFPLLIILHWRSWSHSSVLTDSSRVLHQVKVD